jgi:hypothetical protein
MITSTGFTYSLGPYIIHLSPDNLLTPSLSTNSLFANKRRASSSERIVIFYTPDSSDSPGCKKNVFSPFLNSFAPH